MEKYYKDQDYTIKMKIKKNHLKLLFILIILISSLLYFATKEDPYKTSVAQCLTEKNAEMYGAFWCGACAKQKEVFGNSFKHINNVECDPRGNNANPEKCQMNNIEAYPTWIINGEKIVGVKTIDELSILSECNEL